VTIGTFGGVPFYSVITTVLDGQGLVITHSYVDPFDASLDYWHKLGKKGKRLKPEDFQAAVNRRVT
jgi:hypothetical protein